MFHTRNHLTWVTILWKMYNHYFRFTLRKRLHIMRDPTGTNEYVTWHTHLMRYKNLAFGLGISQIAHFTFSFSFGENCASNLCRHSSTSFATLFIFWPCEFGCDFKTIIFNLVYWLVIHNALRWMSRGLTDYDLTLVQIMAWLRQTTNHYLGQS